MLWHHDGAGLSRADMAYRFRCTACGKCCYGQLPLTIEDALHHAQRFPLAMVWTPIRQASKDFEQVAQLGAVFNLPNRQQLAALIVPTAYLPPSFPCPALSADNLCSIHNDKPLRCKAMPFYPYRDEQYQAELLVPRAGWQCDTSETAPIVFADKRMVQREDFDQEQQALLAQQPLIRRYADYMLKYTPNLLNSLIKASATAKAGQVTTSLSSFLTAIRHPAVQTIAAGQLAVLEQYLGKTAGQPALVEFHNHYRASFREMQYLATKG